MAELSFLSFYDILAGLYSIFQCGKTASNSSKGHLKNFHVHSETQSWDSGNLGIVLSVLLVPPDFLSKQIIFIT